MNPTLTLSSMNPTLTLSSIRPSSVPFAVRPSLNLSSVGFRRIHSVHVICRSESSGQGEKKKDAETPDGGFINRKESKAEASKSRGNRPAGWFEEKLDETPDRGLKSNKDVEYLDSHGTTVIAVIFSGFVFLGFDSRATREKGNLREIVDECACKCIKLADNIYILLMGRRKELYEGIRYFRENASAWNTSKNPLESIITVGWKYLLPLELDMDLAFVLCAVTLGVPQIKCLVYNSAKTSHVAVYDFQKVFLGSGANIALKYFKAKFSNSVEIDAVKENMAYSLLMAAMGDFSTGGTLSVGILSAHGFKLLSEMTTLESIYAFYDDMDSDVLSRSLFVIYKTSEISNSMMEFWFESRLCEVDEIGHPLTKLNFGFYLQQIVFVNCDCASKALKQGKQAAIPLAETIQELTQVQINNKSLFIFKSSKQNLLGLIPLIYKE